VPVLGRAAAGVGMPRPGCPARRMPMARSYAAPEATAIAHDSAVFLPHGLAAQRWRPPRAGVAVQRPPARPNGARFLLLLSFLSERR
jgi:hypothetical protein